MKPQNFLSVQELTDLALQDIQKKPMGLPTGLYELDNKIKGFSESEYIIIAGRPSMGKTALAVDIALNIADKSKVVFFSLEMSPIKLVQRMLANLSNVDLYAFSQGQMLDAAYDELVKAKKKLMKKHILFDNSSYITPYEISNRLAQLDSFDIVFIDYIQLMGIGGREDKQRFEEVAKISRQLKSLSIETTAPIVTLSQLNRSPDLREKNHRPFLSDLRESGSIEQDADIVLFVYRDGYYYPQKDNGSAEIIVAKNRNGPTGTIHCYFNKPVGRFENYKEKSDW